jgi:hypothetical protein
MKHFSCAGWAFVGRIMTLSAAAIIVAFACLSVLLLAARFIQLTVRVRPLLITPQPTMMIQLYVPLFTQQLSICRCFIL